MRSAPRRTERLGGEPASLFVDSGGWIALASVRDQVSIDQVTLTVVPGTGFQSVPSQINGQTNRSYQTVLYIQSSAPGPVLGGLRVSSTAQIPMTVLVNPNVAPVQIIGCNAAGMDGALEASLCGDFWLCVSVSLLRS